MEGKKGEEKKKSNFQKHRENLCLKKVKKEFLHTYAHDTIVDFRPGIMIDPFYE